LQNELITKVLSNVFQGAPAALLLASLGWPFAVAGQDRPLDLVESVDLQRYQGLWYEIARLPNRFQDQCARNVMAEYALMDNGRIEVVNRCTLSNGDVDEARGVARRPDPAREAALKVRFAPRWLSWLPIVWGDYQIMVLADDYESVLIGAPSRKYLWILARKPLLTDSRIDQLKAEAERQGFDSENMTLTQQDAAGDERSEQL